MRSARVCRSGPSVFADAGSHPAGAGSLRASRSLSRKLRTLRTGHQQRIARSGSAALRLHPGALAPPAEPRSAAQLRARRAALLASRILRPDPLLPVLSPLPYVSTIPPSFAAKGFALPCPHPFGAHFVALRCGFRARPFASHLPGGFSCITGMELRTRAA